jgi:hypothetical protein
MHLRAVCTILLHLGVQFEYIELPAAPECWSFAPSFSTFGGGLIRQTFKAWKAMEQLFLSASTQILEWKHKRVVQQPLS